MSLQAGDLLRRCAIDLGIHLDDDKIILFSSFAQELKKWNRKINLTAIRNDRDIVVKHFTDSLTLVGVVNETGSLLDIGSGAGFPAIPLKIMLPGLSVVSVDAVEKKVMFQRQVARLLHLHDFDAHHVRAEEMTASHASHFDWIVSRAFSDLPYFVSLALPLLKDDGRIIAMKGRDGLAEADNSGRQLFDLGASIRDCIHLTLPACGDDRYLVVIEKSPRCPPKNIQ